MTSHQDNASRQHTKTTPHDITPRQHPMTTPHDNTPRQFTKYQLRKLVRETSVIDLKRTVSSTIYQFSAFFKYSIINRYDPICTIDHCYVCG